MDVPYVVSARKYRPSSFNEVVGQKHITDTLEHEVTSGNIPQALLFCGPKGVGKTSCARILANRINEVHSSSDISFDLNVFELDAASNNKVDDIRQLIDQVRFAPQVGKYKVYIIDEVHMLSTAAFNAFLKTLEEPPLHAIFILATTEKNKVLPTILSRCQVFDFKKIEVKSIAEHLKLVADKENVQAEYEALHLIAEKSEGSLRDSLSIFDRIHAFSREQKISYELVRENLQILDRDIFFKTLDDLVNHDASALFLTVNKVIAQGFDLKIFVNGLASHIRDVLLAIHPETIEIMNCSGPLKEKYREQSSRMNPNFLGHSLKLLTNCDLKISETSSPRLLVEVTLLDIGELTHSNDELKKKTSRSPKVVENKISTDLPDQKIKKISSSQGKADFHIADESANKSEISRDLKLETIETKKEAIPTKSNPNSSRKSAFSLRSSSIKNHKVQVESTNEEIRVDKVLTSFNQSDLNMVWPKITEMMINSQVIYALLKQINPILEKDFKIRISVGSRVQSKYFEEARDEIIPLLRTELKNDAISVIVKVEESGSNAKIVYTAEERYQFLLEKNPQLDDFRKEFQLDID
jgi:DNA polymerase-3 subunit gamma/tau